MLFLTGNADREECGGLSLGWRRWPFEDDLLEFGQGGGVVVFEVGLNFRGGDDFADRILRDGVLSGEMVSLWR